MVARAAIMSPHFALITLNQDVCDLGAESRVSDRTRLLPCTLPHALVVLHNALLTGHETSHNGPMDEHIKENM